MTHKNDAPPCLVSLKGSTLILQCGSNSEQQVPLAPRQTNLMSVFLAEVEPAKPVPFEKLRVAISADENLRVHECFAEIKSKISKRLHLSDKALEPYVVWENKRGQGYDLKPSWHVRGDTEPPPSSQETMEALNQSLLAMYWGLSHRKSVDLYDLFFDVMVACRQLLHRNIHEGSIDEVPFLWLNILIRVIANEGQQLGPQKTARVLEELNRIRQEDHEPLWAWERYALYLELIGHFRSAAQTSEDTVKLARQHSVLFMAALYARAADCYEQVDDKFAAAKAAILAADLMTENGRLSQEGLKYYQRVGRLTPSAPHRRRADEAAMRQMVALKQSGHAQYSLVLVRNAYDAVFADWLVEPLAKAGIACDCKNSTDVGDLADLCSYAAVIVVGGVHAVQTDWHIHQYFADEMSLREKIRPKDLEVKIRPYSDWWRQEINGCLIYLLGGLSRLETCQAILDFVKSKDEEHCEFSRLVTTIYSREGQDA